MAGVRPPSGVKRCGKKLQGLNEAYSTRLTPFHPTRHPARSYLDDYQKAGGGQPKRPGGDRREIFDKRPA